MTPFRVLERPPVNGRVEIDSMIEDVVDRFWNKDEDLKKLLRETAAHEAHYGELDSDNPMRLDIPHLNEMKKDKYAPALAHMGAKRKEDGDFDVSDLHTNVILGSMRYLTKENGVVVPKIQSERIQLWKDVYNTKAGKGTIEAMRESLKKFDMLEDDPKFRVLKQGMGKLPFRVLGSKRQAGFWAVEPEEELIPIPIEGEFAKQIELATDKVMKHVYSEKQLAEMKSGKRRQDFYGNRILPFVTMALSGMPIRGMGYEVLGQAKNVIVSKIKEDTYKPEDIRWISELIPEDRPVLRTVGGIAEWVTDVALISTLAGMGKGKLLEGTLKEIGTKLQKAGYGEGKLTVTKAAIRKAVKGSTLERETGRWLKAKQVEISAKAPKIAPPGAKIPPTTPPRPPGTPQIGVIPIQPKAGGLPHKLPETLIKKGIKIEDLKSVIAIDKTMTVKDIHGDKVELPEGEEYRAYELSNGQVLLQDGKQVVVNKGQFQNVKGQQVELGEKPSGVKEVWKGDVISQKEYDRYKELYNKKRSGQGLLGKEAEDWERLKDTSGLVKPTKFSQHQAVKGGENYRELLLQVPVTERFGEFEKTLQELKNKYERGEVSQEEYDIEGKKLYRKKPRQDIYKSPHYDEPNVVSHIRMSDFTTPDGKKVLQIQEIQSDWAREGREKGFVKELTKNNIIAVRKGETPYWEATDKEGNFLARNRGGMSKDEFIDYVIDVGNTGKLPFHPTVKNWKELSVRKILETAVREGYDYVALPTGEQQANLYDLSKQIGVINWHKNELGDGKIRIDALTPDLGTQVINESFKPEELERVVGKDIAHKIIDGEGQTDELYSAGRRMSRGELKGLDLKTGGEALKSLYDVQIPAEFKKYGAEITEIKVGREGADVDIAGEPLHGERDLIQPAIAITPKLRTRVIGQPKAGGVVPPIPPQEVKGLGGIEGEGSGVVKQYENQKDIWIGNKDVKILQSKVEKRTLQKELSTVLGKVKYDVETQDYDKAIQLYIDTKRNPEHIAEYYKSLTPERQRIVDLSQDLPDNVKKVADKISASYQQVGLEALDAGVIRNVLDNYVARVWDIKDKAASEKFRKFGATTRHAKKRKYGTTIEGWAHGLNSKVEGATNNLQILKEEIAKTIEDKKFLKVLQKIKTVDGEALLSTQQFEGYVRIEHPNFKVWKYAGKVTPGQTEGLEKGAWKGSKTIKNVVKDMGGIDFEKAKSAGYTRQDFKEYGIQDVLNPNGQGIDDIAEQLVDSGILFPQYDQNPSDALIEALQQKALTLDYAEYKELPSKEGIYGKNFFRDEEGNLFERRDLYAPKEQAKNINNILGISKLKGIPGIDFATKYNAVVKAWILQSSLFHHLAFMRSYYFGTNHKKWGEMSVRQAYRQGVKAIEEENPVVMLGVKNGLTLGLKQDWDEELLRETSNIDKYLDKIKVVGSVKNKVLDLRQKHVDFLFGEFGAGLKAKSFMIEFKNLSKKHPNKSSDEIAKMVANLINDDFGGLHLQRLGRNPTVQHIFRLFALAPDWCCTGDTRAMTKTGWRYHHELRIGVDEVLAFNPETKKYQWSNLNDMYVNENYNGKMVKIKNFNRSVMMTPEHTCYVYNSTTKRNDIVKACELQTNHQIPRCAEFDTPTKEKFDDYFIKIVGWVVTDGHVRTDKWERKDGTFGERKRGCITQAKPKTVEILKQMRMKYSTSQSKNHDKFVSNFLTYKFVVPNSIIKKMEKLNLTEGLNWNFLSTLTKRQLQLLYDTMMLGDGTGQKRFCGKEKEVFFMTMIQTMLGLPSTFYQQEKNCWRTRWITRGKSISCWGHHNNKVEINYKGLIWCPSVDTGFWLAEREGLMFITGNTESNVRTMVKAIKAGSKEETNFYRKFWAGIFTKGAILTILGNALMAGWDEDDKEGRGIWGKMVRNYKRAWNEGRMRWMDVDITALYKMLGGKTKNRKYFSVLGHFKDPIKFITHPIRSAHHKGSIMYGFFHEALTGVDWAGRRFTTAKEILGIDKEKGLYKTTRKGKYRKGDPKWGKLKGKTVTWDFKGRGPLSYNQILSFALSQVKGAMPVQIQNLLAWLAGEMEGFGALLKSAGLRVSTTYDKAEKKSTKWKVVKKKRKWEIAK